MLAPKSYLLAYPAFLSHTSTLYTNCTVSWGLGSELHGVSCFGDECMKVC